MRPMQVTFSFVAADPDGIATSQAVYPTSLTLDGALADTGTVTLPIASPVTLASTDDLSGATFTVTGTAQNGGAQSESITGPNNDGVATTKAFKTITSITSNFVPSETVHAGTAALATAVCASQLAATTATINGSLAVTGAVALPHGVDVTIASTSNLSAFTFTVHGTNTAGGALTEAIAGPNNGTVTTTNAFKTVTSITSDVSGITSEHITAGFAASATAVLAAQPVATTATINGDMAVGGSVTLAHGALQVTLASTSDLSAATFTVTGTDSAGAAQHEDIAGPDNNTVTTTAFFKTITSVTSDFAASEMVEAGVDDAGDTGEQPWMPLDLYNPNQVTSISVNKLSGSANYDVQYTNEDPFDLSITQLDTPHPDAAFTAATASHTASTLVLMRAVRININSGTASLRMTVTQQSTA